MTDPVYQVMLAPDCAREFRRLDAGIRAKLKKKMEILKVTPISYPNIKKLTSYSDIYRLRVDDYRIVYQLIHNKLIVYIIGADHRKQVYKSLNKFVSRSV